MGLNSKTQPAPIARPKPISTSTSSPSAAQRSVKDAHATRSNIMDVATQEFAEHGFSGARIDVISDKTRTSKRMLYYHFKDKKGLYQAVLENYYVQRRKSETCIKVEHLNPVQAIRSITEQTLDYHVSNANVVRLIMVENIARGRNMDELPSLEPLNSILIEDIRKACVRGFKDGSMRKLSPERLYMSILALSFFVVSNRYTFPRLFGVDLTSEGALEIYKGEVLDMITRYVAPERLQPPGRSIEFSRLGRST